ncbi:unnamed protein product [Sphagnum tenellum]
MTLGEADWMPGFSLHQKQLIADVLCEVPQLPYPQTPALPEVMPHPSRANSWTLKGKQNQEPILRAGQKTVVVSLWNNMAMNEGATLSNTVNDSPVLMVKSLRASDFQGVSLSTTSNSMVAINPDIPEAIALRNWSVLC